MADDGIHYKRKTIVLDGTENWIIQGDRYFTVDTKRNNIQKDVNPDFISNIGKVHYSVLDNQTGYGLAFTYYWRINLKNIDARNGGTVEQLKAYLQENPITVEYELAEEIVEEYTAEQQEAHNKLKELYSYEGVTHITCENDIKANMEIIYSKQQNIEIQNEGNKESRPVLKLIKTLDDYVDITINQVRFKYNFVENEDYVEIDCENKTVVYDNLNRNRQIEIGYDFPKLNIGTNVIVINSGDCIIQIKRKDRWL